jgi:hypothetical protein
MHRLLAAPAAELLEFNFAFYELLIPAGIVILPFANGAAKRD